MLTPGGIVMRRVHAEEEWGWESENENILDATGILINYFINDRKIGDRVQAMLAKAINSGKHPDIIRQDLLEYFMNSVTSRMKKLGDPFYSLILLALDDVDWDSLADYYMDAYAGPQLWDDVKEPAYESDLLNDQVSIDRGSPKTKDLPYQDYSVYTDYTDYEENNPSTTSHT